jgi:hypothetical protein
MTPLYLTFISTETTYAWEKSWIYGWTELWSDCRVSSPANLKKRSLSLHRAACHSNPSQSAGNYFTSFAVSYLVPELMAVKLNALERFCSVPETPQSVWDGHCPIKRKGGYICWFIMRSTVRFLETGAPIESAGDLETNGVGLLLIVICLNRCAVTAPITSYFGNKAIDMSLRVG